MSVYSKRVGLRNVGSYQVSGIPWVTGSSSASSFATDKTTRYQFPYVTKSITVINTGASELRVHFQSGSGVIIGVDGAPVSGDANDDVQHSGNHHFITVPSSNGAMTFDVKCKEIYLSNHSGGSTGYEIFAELTQIPVGSMYNLTGSGITG
jgi:hypothetical protein